MRFQIIMMIEHLHSFVLISSRESAARLLRKFPDWQRAERQVLWLYSWYLPWSIYNLVAGFDKGFELAKLCLLFKKDAGSLSYKLDLSFLCHTVAIVVASDFFPLWNRTRNFVSSLDWVDFIEFQKVLQCWICSKWYRCAAKYLA